MVGLHGVALSIIFDHSTQFTFQFLKSFQKGLGILVVNLVRHFILKLMGKCSILSKLCNICWEFVWLTSKVFETVICLWLSFLIIVVTIQALVWLHLRLFIVGGVDIYIDWFEVGEISLIGPKLVHEAMDKNWLIRERLKKNSKSTKVLCQCQKEIS